MRLVIQRVSEARVRVGDRVIGEIGRGLLVFAGVSHDDAAADVSYSAGKIGDLRLFAGEDGKGFERSVRQVGGSVLVVSQFTLYGDVRKGRRPAFNAAATPLPARQRYDELVTELRASGLRVETGEFQATMHVESIIDGPVTVLVDSTRSF